jgi:hypothetical protein
VSIGSKSPIRPAGLSAAAVRISSSGVASSIVNGPDAVRVSAPRYAALPSVSPEVSRKRPDVGARRARDVEHGDRPFRVGVLHDTMSSGMDDDLRRANSTVSPARAIA